MAVFIAIAQLGIGKLGSSHCFKLLLYPTAALDGIFEQRFHFIAGDVLIGEQELDQAGHGFAHGDFIALVDLPFR